MSNVHGRIRWKMGKSETIESRQKGSYFGIQNLVTCDRKCNVGGIVCVCHSLNRVSGPSVAFSATSHMLLLWPCLANSGLL